MSNQADVAQLYTAFFNRAPDAAGLAYWVGELEIGKISLEAMAKNWVDEQPEGQAKYPDSSTDAAFIATIYSNVLGRTADPDGAEYWQTQLNSGALSRDVFVAAIIKGAHSNNSTQGVLDAQLLDNKAAVGIAFADKGINNFALAAKVLTTVTATPASLSCSLSLVKLIPSDATLTPVLVTQFVTTLDKLAGLINGSPAEQADLATYLSTLSAGVASGTNLDTLLTKISTVATSALTDPTALDNPAALAAGDVAAATPPVDTGGGGTTTPVVLAAANVEGVLKITGTGDAPVTVDMHTHTATSGSAPVSITGGTAFTGVNASGYDGAVTAIGSVKDLVSGAPVFANVIREVTDDAWTILTWAKYYLVDVVQKVTVEGNAAGTLSVDWYHQLDELTGNQIWTYDIRDSVANINAAKDTDALLNTPQVAVADTLVNLKSAAGGTAIDAYPHYTVLDSYGNISAAIAANDPFVRDATVVVVHDNVAGVQAAISANYTSADGFYEIEDTALNLLDVVGRLVIHAASVLVTGDDAGQLTLAQREALGKVTDDDFWAYTISDTAENIIVGATGTHSDFLEQGRALDVTVKDGFTAAQYDAVTDVAVAKDLDTQSWLFSVSDIASSLSNHNFGAHSVTAKATSGIDALDGGVSTGAVVFTFSQASDAATFSYDAQAFTSATLADSFSNFAAGDKIDLKAFTLTGQEILTLNEVGSQTIGDGHFAVINGVALTEGKYVSSSEAGAGSLVIWDANNATGTAQVTQVGIWLANANLDANAVLANIPA